MKVSRVLGADGDITHIHTTMITNSTMTNRRTIAEEASVSLTLGLVVLTVGSLKLLRVVAHTGSTFQAVSTA